jgi:hypothetical protein
MRSQTISLIIFALLLLGPFILTTVRPDLEPYPAIILPAGAWTISLKTEELSFPDHSIYGRREHNQEWIALDTRRFLDPIPAWYLMGIMSAGLGLEATKTRPTLVDITATKHWFRGRLRAMDFREDAFKVAVELVTLDRQNKRVIRTESRYEKIYVLD